MADSESLLDAVLRNDVYQTMMIMENRSFRPTTNSPSLQNSVFSSPLFLAENSSLIRILLQRGFDARVAEPDSGYTPLHLAAWRGDVESVRILVECGEVDINAVDAVFGETPIFCAAQRGHIDVVKYLLCFDHLDLTRFNAAGVGIVNICPRTPNGRRLRSILEGHLIHILRRSIGDCEELDESCVELQVRFDGLQDETLELEELHSPRHSPRSPTLSRESSARLLLGQESPPSAPSPPSPTETHRRHRTRTRSGSHRRKRNSKRQPIHINTTPKNSSSSHLPEAQSRRERVLSSRSSQSSRARSTDMVSLARFGASILGSASPLPASTPEESLVSRHQIHQQPPRIHRRKREHRHITTISPDRSSSSAPKRHHHRRRKNRRPKKKDFKRSPLTKFGSMKKLTGIGGDDGSGNGSGIDGVLQRRRSSSGSMEEIREMARRQQGGRRSGGGGQRKRNRKRRRQVSTEREGQQQQ